MKKIAIIGFGGRMGRLLWQALSDKFELVGIGREDSIDLAINCDLVIDFSTAENSVKTANWCRLNRKKLIIGATGQSQEGLNQIMLAAKDIPILKAGNFSFGILALKKMLKTMNIESIESVSIIEKHHKNKKDAPSGTAVELAEFIRRELYINPNIYAIRGGEEIGVHSIDIYFGSEVLTISHKAFSRQAFVCGVVKACEKMINFSQTGFYSLEDFLRF